MVKYLIVNIKCKYFKFNFHSVFDFNKGYKIYKECCTISINWDLSIYESTNDDKMNWQDGPLVKRKAENRRILFRLGDRAIARSCNSKRSKKRLLFSRASAI